MVNYKLYYTKDIRIRKVNIGIFTDTYFPQISGVATSILTLKNDLERKGHSVYIFTTTDPNVGKKDYEPNVYRFGSVPFPSFTERRVAIRGLFKAVSIARKLNLDIVHTQTEFSMGYIGKYVAHALKIPAVHTYHTMYEDYLHYIMNGHLLRPSGVKQISRAFLYHMTGLICPSQRVMDTMIRYGIKTPMRIIPTGVDLSQYNISNSSLDLRKEYNIPENGKVLLSLSRVAYEKNIDFLLRSFAELLKKMDNVYLIIVGDGPAIEDLKEQSQQLGIDQSVIFTGYVLHDKVVNYYQQADLFVSASNTEAQGLTFIESLAAKTQVLAWDNDYDRLLLRDPSLGAVFSNEESLTELLYDYLVKEIPMNQELLESELEEVSANHFGDQVIEFYTDLQDRFKNEKQEELDEEEESLMRRVSRYLKLTPHSSPEELNDYPIGYFGEGKHRSLILTSFSKQNYSVFVMPNEDDIRDDKRITVVDNETQLFKKSKIIFTETNSQEEFIRLAEKAQNNQIIVNLSFMDDFDLTILRKKNENIKCQLFDASMVIDDYESITLIVGGNQEKFDEISPIFDVFTDVVIYLGELGAGQIGIQALRTLQYHIKNGVEEALEKCDVSGVDVGSVLDLLSDTDETYFIRHAGNKKLEEFHLRS